jgi:hypothetical protein
MVSSFGRVLFLTTTILLSACGGSSSESTCPSYVVTPDGGVMGFSEVGEWHSDDAVCRQYCESDYTVCQMKTATTVKCQKGCS